MPWHIVEDHSGCPSSKPWAVVKDTDGSVEGCHATESEAQDHMAALYANEPDAATQHSNERLVRYRRVLAARDAIPYSDRYEEVGMTTMISTTTTNAGGITFQDVPDHPCVDETGDGICDQCGQPCEDHPTAAPGEASLVPFVGIATVLDYATEDGRVIESEGFTHRTLPLPLMYQDTNPAFGGHEGAFLIGQITEVQVEDRRVWMSGMLDLAVIERNATNPGGIIEGIRNQTARHVSVDLSAADTEYEVLSTDDEGWPDEVLARFSNAVMAGATVTPFPAIPDAVIWLDGESEPVEATHDLPEPVEPMDPENSADALPLLIIGAASGSTSLPLSDRERAWDASAADGRVRSWAGAEDGPNAKYGRAFFSKTGTGENFGDYGLPFADVIDGTLTAVWRGVTAVAAAIQGGRGANIEGADAIKPRVATYYHKAARQYDDDSITPPWESSASAMPLIASAATMPPFSYFDDPCLDDLTALTILEPDENGYRRCFGHVAPWGVCHVGLPGCVTMPPSHNDYASFNTGAVWVRCDCADSDCEDVIEMATGRITFGTVHAGLDLDAAHALAHYEDTGMVGADVAAGGDEHGVWVNGVLRPEVTEEQVRALRAAPPSVDCRRIGASLELIALLAVNVPGYPVPRPRARLVASGARMVQTALIGPIDPRAGALTAAARPEQMLVVVDRQAWERLHSRLEGVEAVARALRAQAIDALAASLTEPTS